MFATCASYPMRRAVALSSYPWRGARWRRVSTSIGTTAVRSCSLAFLSSARYCLCIAAHDFEGGLAAQIHVGQSIARAPRVPPRHVRTACARHVADPSYSSLVAGVGSGLASMRLSSSPSMRFGRQLSVQAASSAASATTDWCSWQTNGRAAI